MVKQVPFHQCCHLRNHWFVAMVVNFCLFIWLKLISNKPMITSHLKKMWYFLKVKNIWEKFLFLMSLFTCNLSQISVCNHREPLVPKIGKPIEKLSLPMVDPARNHRWRWWEFSKTITISSLEKNNHHHSIVLKNWPSFRSTGNDLDRWGISALIHCSLIWHKSIPQNRDQNFRCCWEINSIIRERRFASRYFVTFFNNDDNPVTFKSTDLTAQCSHLDSIVVSLSNYSLIGRRQCYLLTVPVPICKLAPPWNEKHRYICQICRFLHLWCFHHLRWHYLSPLKCDKCVLCVWKYMNIFKHVFSRNQLCRQIEFGRLIVLKVGWFPEGCCPLK